MTLEEVEVEFRREFNGTLPSHRYEPSSWHYCLDPNDGRFNAEIISIGVREGRVVTAEYLPD